VDSPHSVRPLRMGRVAVLIGLVCAAAAALFGPRAWGELVEMEIFRVVDLELSGARYVTFEDAVALAAVPGNASVWDDPTSWEEGISSHPLVASARVRRRLPGTLLIEIEERVPVALVPTPTLEPVDREGRILPLDPALLGLDLPLLETDGAVSSTEVRAFLAGQAERLGRIDPAFAARTSDLSRDPQGDLIARWGDPRVTFRMPASVTARRLDEAAVVLADAAARFGAPLQLTVDLRFADQVVVRAP